MIDIEINIWNFLFFYLFVGIESLGIFSKILHAFE